MHVRQDKKKGRDATTHVSQLICDPWERSTESERAHLGKLDRNDAPRALHAKLHPESAGCESAETGRKNPERDKYLAEENKDDRREPAPDVLRHGSCNGIDAGIYKK
jgi:hypothetical protein